ncbi:MAG: hypothetical protein WBA57_21690 [Elainellaceae cyanobacterium]
MSKRYRQIQNDLRPVIEALQNGRFDGDRVPGTSAVIFKIRAKNSDIPVGKSGGYRLIYQLVAPEQVLLLLIYVKSDQADVSIEEIEDAVKEASEE